MTRITSKNVSALSLATVLIIQALVLSKLAAAQEEVASAIRRYADREASTGYYEQYEVIPRRQLALVEIPGVKRGLFAYSPTASRTWSRAQIRTRLADSHVGIKFYDVLRCDYCHPHETKDIHTTRANLTCRQCHGGEPIASIEHFYSPLNPIRRHAYVCAKCHEGASASFASYVVHEPLAGSSNARSEFPLLYYAYWFMLILLAGTLAFFIPHAFLFGARELFAKIKKPQKDAGPEENAVDKEDEERPGEREIEPHDQQGDAPDVERDDRQDHKLGDGKGVEGDDELKD